MSGCLEYLSWYLTICVTVTVAVITSISGSNSINSNRSGVDDDDSFGNAVTCVPVTCSLLTFWEKI